MLLKLARLIQTKYAIISVLLEICIRVIRNEMNTEKKFLLVTIFLLIAIVGLLISILALKAMTDINHESILRLEKICMDIK